MHFKVTRRRRAHGASAPRSTKCKSKVKRLLGFPCAIRAANELSSTAAHRTTPRRLTRPELMGKIDSVVMRTDYQFLLASALFLLLMTFPFSSFHLRPPTCFASQSGFWERSFARRCRTCKECRSRPRLTLSWQFRSSDALRYRVPMFQSRPGSYRQSPPFPSLACISSHLFQTVQNSR